MPPKKDDLVVLDRVPWEVAGGRSLSAYLVSIASLVLYIALFISLLGVIGVKTAAMASMLVPFTFAICFGLRMGVLAAILTPLLTTLLVYLAVDDWVTLVARPAFVVHNFAAIVVSASIGHIRDISWRLRLEAARRRATEKDRNKYRDHLQQLVKARTHDLEAANRDLEQQIARRRKTEIAFAEQGEQLNAVLNSIGDGVLTIDKQFRILHANPTAVQQLKLLCQGVQVGDVIPHLSGLAIETLVAQPPGERTGHEIEASQPIRAVYEITPSPMKMNNRVDGWVLIVREVTDEREARRRNESQERLAAVGQLAAGIAHDFNNTLFGMMGYTQLLQRLPDMPQTAEERLKKIYQGGERAAEMIKQILDFSRKSPARQKPISLNAVVQNAMEFFQRTLPENIEKTLTIDPGAYVVMANPTQLQQMLTNLAVNARDAMSKGGRLCINLGRLELERADQRPFPEMADGPWLVLSVSDTGCGILKEALPRVFEPFFTTKPQAEGTGLGLAQVYGIVKQHHGFVDVETQHNAGTAFNIYLPGLDEGDAESRKISIPHPLPGGGEVILFVDDDALVLESGREMLEALGYRPLTATNGKEAMEIYTERRDDVALIITDLVMPEMDGEDLLEALRDQKSSTRVIVLSGYPMKSDLQALYKENVVATAAKPLHIMFLGKLIRETLEHQ